MCGSPVVILALQLLTFLFTGGTGRLQCAKVDRTRLDIGNLESALDLYRVKTGHYPDSATSFAALIDLGVIDKQPIDVWGNPYRYQLVGGRPVIISFGADGQPGGEGIAADISNRVPEVQPR